MNENIVENLKMLLSRFFKDEWYREGIENLRSAIKIDPYYHSIWEPIIKMVILKQIPNGEALEMIFENANQCLHENSEDEAYKWLLLMIINVSRGNDEPILDDQKFLTRNTDTIS